MQVSKDEKGRLRIAVVANSSPAEKAGVQVGDILVSVNGKAATTYSKQCALFPFRDSIAAFIFCINMLSFKPPGLDLDSKPLKPEVQLGILINML